MVEKQLTRYSYARAAREVVPSLYLKRFKAQLDNLAVTLLDLQARAVVPDQDDSDNKIRLLNIPAIDDIVYPTQSLRLTQLEQSMEPSPRNNNKLSKLLSRMENYPLLQQELGLIATRAEVRVDEVTITVSGIKESTKPEFTHLGREYALTAHRPLKVVQMLLHESEALHERGRQTGIGNEIITGQPNDAILIPIFRLPPDVDAFTQQRYVDSAQRYLPVDGLDVTLEKLEWDKKSR